MKVLRQFCSILVLGFAMLLFGCASFDSYVDTNKMLVMAGTMKAIEKGSTPELRHARAEAALALVERTRTWLNFEKLTLAQLKFKLDAEILGTNWPPSDKLIAQELVNQVVRKLQDRVIDDVQLPVQPEEAVYQLNKVLDWIESAARLY